MITFVYSKYYSELSGEAKARYEDKQVLYAHCICMVGIGEACSHIAALLFAAEANTQLKSQYAST